MQYRLRFNARRGVFEVRWSERLPSGAWRSRALSTGTDQEHAAQAFLGEFIRAEHAAEDGVGKLTVEQLAARYLESATLRGVSRSQKASLKPVRAFFGALYPETIRDVDVLKYRVQRRAKDGTLRRELGALRRVLSYAMQQKLLDANSVPHIELPPMPQARDLFLSDFDEQEFYALAMGDSIGRRTLSRVTKFVAIALDTGARRGAICSLTWDRVDLAHGLIDFREPGRKVSNKRRALVPISQRLRPVLERAHRERHIHHHSAREDLVVGSIKMFQREWGAWISTTRFKWVTPHVLRHTFATLQVRAGADLVDVAAILGDNPVTVTKTYRHHSPAHLRQSIDARWK